MIAEENSICNCPECNEVGQVVRFNALGIYVRMECPRCKAKWKTLSKICPKCYKPNGFAVEGPCGHCYSLYYKTK